MEMRIGNSITPRTDWPIISSHALRGIRFIVNCGLEQELDFQRTICFMGFVEFTSPQTRKPRLDKRYSTLWRGPLDCNSRRTCLLR